MPKICKCCQKGFNETTEFFRRKTGKTAPKGVLQDVCKKCESNVSYLNKIDKVPKEQRTHKQALKRDEIIEYFRLAYLANPAARSIPQRLITLFEQGETKPVMQHSVTAPEDPIKQAYMSGADFSRLNDAIEWARVFSCDEQQALYEVHKDNLDQAIEAHEGTEFGKSLKEFAGNLDFGCV